MFVTSTQSRLRRVAFARATPLSIACWTPSVEDPVISMMRYVASLTAVLRLGCWAPKRTPPDRLLRRGSALGWRGTRSRRRGAHVIQHIVLLKWKPDTTEEQILTAFRRAEHLPNEIDGVDSLTIGRNRVRHDHGFTHALIVRLSDEEALRNYLEHPLRKQYVEEHLKP